MRGDRQNHTRSPCRPVTHLLSQNSALSKMADYYKREAWALSTSTLISTEEAHFHGGGSFLVGGGDRGAGARENRGREGYGRRERKGREAGVLRGRAAGEKYETLIFLIQQYVRLLSKTRTQNIRANYNAGLD